MALCKDPSLTYLNQQGYNVVKLPRVGISPMDILGREAGSIEHLGKLTEIWTSSAPPPRPKPPKNAASIEGRQTSQLKISIGLKLLSNILGGMGSQIPELELAYSGASCLQFGFSSVQVSNISPFQIGKYLSQGDLETQNPFVAHYFQDDDTEAFVIFETLISNSISVVANDKAGIGLSVDIPAVQNIVGTNVSVSSVDDKNTIVTYTGNDFLTFGFKIFGIEYADGNWQVEGLRPDEDFSFDTQVAHTTTLLKKTGRVSLKALET